MESIRGRFFFFSPSIPAVGRGRATRRGIKKCILKCILIMGVFGSFFLNPLKRGRGGAPFDVRWAKEKKGRGEAAMQAQGVE